MGGRPVEIVSASDQHRGGRAVFPHGQVQDEGLHFFDLPSAGKEGDLLRLLRGDVHRGGCSMPGWF